MRTKGAYLINNKPFINPVMKLLKNVVKDKLLQRVSLKCAKIVINILISLSQKKIKTHGIQGIVYINAKF